jgi:cytochrome b6-f complex iron-sulfur subunit
MTEKPVSRRDFLKLAIQGLFTLGGALGLAGLVRFFSYESEPPQPTEYDLGPAENYDVGSRTTLPEIPAILIREADGFRALSLVCTHLGCTVGVEGDGFLCPCHGSQYSLSGSVLQGPASSPLKTLRLEQTPEGNIILHMK